MRRAVDIAQDHAVVLHHPARGAAGAAGVDDTGEVVAGDSRHRRFGGAHIGVVTVDHVVPVVDRQLSLLRCL